MVDFSSETMENRRQWNSIFNTLNQKTVNPEFNTQQNHPSKMKMK